MLIERNGLKEIFIWTPEKKHANPYEVIPMTVYEEETHIPSISELRQLEHRNSVLQVENNELRRKLRKSNQTLVKENESLKERNYRLERQLEGVRVKKQVKARTIAVYDIYDNGKHVFTGTVKECVEHFNISRKTVYYWRDHPGKMSAVIVKEIGLEEYRKRIS
ncbi:hypothetical protein RWE15_10255 [Virgibacillus halophilus]|uniref:Uncharacterized protein n=2 Tax=Tigheibacillus halophilus TaxID=361280 RepID=A0ABU5C854_9BACI|nr:hypothetical protein [Virgibacillus halophilus]